MTQRYYMMYCNEEEIIKSIKNNGFDNISPHGYMFQAIVPSAYDSKEECDKLWKNNAVYIEVPKDTIIFGCYSPRGSEFKIPIEELMNIYNNNDRYMYTLWYKIFNHNSPQDALLIEKDKLMTKNDVIKHLHLPNKSTRLTRLLTAKKNLYSLIWEHIFIIIFVIVYCYFCF